MHVRAFFLGPNPSALDVHIEKAKQEIEDFRLTIKNLSSMIDRHPTVEERMLTILSAANRGEGIEIGSGLRGTMMDPEEVQKHAQAIRYMQTK